jgi:p-cumate 2,3-dioxygenase alpha subunit
VREKKGNALSFRCFYHGWSFNVNGRFASRFEEGSYGKEHYGGGCADLAEVPRLESYRDFWFVNFDRNAGSLLDYLAGAKEYIDLVADHAEAGMEIVGNGHDYVINANWKLLAENSVDAFHGVPVHKTYFDYLQNVGSLRAEHDFEANRIGMTDLGDGHAVIESRPGAGQSPGGYLHGARKLASVSKPCGGSWCGGSAKSAVFASQRPAAT